MAVTIKYQQKDRPVKPLALLSNARLKEAARLLKWSRQLPGNPVRYEVWREKQ